MSLTEAAASLDPRTVARALGGEITERQRAWLDAIHDRLRRQRPDGLRRSGGKGVRRADIRR
jgi:hypothetical protein